MTTPLAAGKAAERAGKALTGDIYTRRWTTVRGAGRKKTAVEHELRVNPVGIGLGTAALGVTAVGAAVTLWALQMRIAPTTASYEYGKWVWVDGTDASKETLLINRGVAPTRVTGYTDVWKLYVGGFPNPYIVVPEGTEGAVLTRLPIIETATWTVTATKTETHFALKERRGFSVLGGDQPLPEVTDVARTVAPAFVSPIAVLIDLLRR